MKIFSHKIALKINICCTKFSKQEVRSPPDNDFLHTLSEIRFFIARNEKKVFFPIKTTLNLPYKQIN